MAHIPDDKMTEALTAVGAMHGVLFATGQHVDPALQPLKAKLLTWLKTETDNPSLGCQAMLEVVGATFATTGAPVSALTEMAKASAAHILAAALAANA